MTSCQATTGSALTRCPWAELNSQQTAYHDTEWGAPSHDDRALFELHILEGAQAGLAWDTILKKREGYRQAFAGFDPSKVARFDAAKVEEMLANPAIVRNRLKIESAIRNAASFLAVQAQFGSFDAYIWQFVGGEPIRNAWRGMGEVPASTLHSDAMSKDLRKRGFKFVGTTICYAFMQATGMVNDHLVDCFRRDQVGSPAHVTG